MSTSLLSRQPSTENLCGLINNVNVPSGNGHNLNIIRLPGWRKAMGVVIVLLMMAAGESFAQTGTTTYTVTGNSTFNVPAGVSSVTIYAQGAGGGGGGKQGSGG